MNDIGREYLKGRLIYTGIAVALTALLYFCGTDFNQHWLLTWFAPLPILILGLASNKLWTIFISAFVARFIGGLNFIYYLATPVPMQVFIPGKIIEASFFAIIVVVFCLVVKRTRVWYGLFIFPLSFVLCEFIFAQFSPAGTIASLAYSQMHLLPIIQIASITGFLGITFLLNLIPAALSVSWYLSTLAKSYSLSLIIPLGILFLALAFGCYQLSVPGANNIVRIGLLAVPETTHELLSTEQDNTETIAKRFIKELPALKQQGASIVLMPEKFIAISPEDQQKILGLFQSAAKKNQLDLILGVNQLSLNKKINAVLVINKYGKLSAYYMKQHLLGVFEHAYEQGRHLLIWPLTNGYAGFAICKDMDFLFPALAYSQNRVGILFVPALDFKVDDWLHAAPAIMRGIEGGYSVVRVAQRGLLTVSDSRGRVLAWRKTSTEKVAAIVVDVPIGTGNTLFSKCHYWFALFCMCCLILIMVALKK